MAEFIISCDTFARLSHMCGREDEKDCDEFFRSIRIDNGVAVATNRKIMAIENIGGPSGVVHLKPDPALIVQCKAEAGYGGKLTVLVNDQLKFAIAKTTFGFTSGNIGVFSDQPTRFDIWRTLIEQVKTPITASRGGMFWNVDMVTRLAASSPSGDLFFEEFIDVSGHRPCIITDKNDYNWCALLNPHIESGNMSVPAALPSWL